MLKALPMLRFVKCCLKKPKKDFRLALRKSLLKKMDMKMPKTDIQLENDPFLRLGKKDTILILTDHLNPYFFRFWNECLFRYPQIFDDSHVVHLRFPHPHHGNLPILWRH